MSTQLGKLCSLILFEHFGEQVRLVGDDLFAAFSKSKNLISISTKLTREQVASSLAVLVQYRLVKFQSLEQNENVAEYTLLHDKVLLIQRYPRYVHHIQKKFGQSSALLLETLLKTGIDNASSLIIRSVRNSDIKEKSALQEFRDCFEDMVKKKYFIRNPEITDDPVPVTKKNHDRVFQLPTLNLMELVTLFENPAEIASDSSIYWMVNLDQFHQNFRDELMVKAIERQIDPNASECFQLILQLMYSRTNPWVGTSNPISMGEIKSICEKKSNNAELVKFVDQYVSIIESDATGFLQNNGDSGGGLYSITMANAFEKLTWSAIEIIITQKFGSKATRIFRVIRSKKYIEQEDIQKEAMIPAKEAKLFTYKLLEENFLQIQTIKKPGGGGMGPAKAFYLFYVNQYHIVLMLIETCYKALYNAITRSAQDKETNKRLMEKSLRLESIVEAMKDRGESDELIQEILETLTPPEKEILEKVTMRLKRLVSSEVVIDEVLLLFQLFIYYQSPTNKT
ncbi:unnamed protein product [Diamesa tonsa]